jgi:hypothetical protein
MRGPQKACDLSARGLFMHNDSTLATAADGPVLGPWSVLEGGSVGIVLGFGIDLVRLGLHSARRTLAARPPTPCGWHRQRPCDAGSR